MYEASEKISLNDLGDNTNKVISHAMEQFLKRICELIPKVGPHILSGGVLSVKTMSGMVINVGFSPTQKGIILPGGINPLNPGSLPKGF